MKREDLAMQLLVQWLGPKGPDHWEHFYSQPQKTKEVAVEWAYHLADMLGHESGRFLEDEKLPR